jgi:hypothetical protein
VIVKRRQGITAALVSVLLATAAPAQILPAGDALARGFADPPPSARPRTWWHWLNGNITTEGIDEDLDWMKRVGLGGAEAFDASLGTPQIVATPLPYMTPAWKAAFAHAAANADSLGLELGISSSPGWSETGGPWVPPADGMKKLVWSQLDIDGGRRFDGALPPRPGVTGPYGTAPFNDPMSSFTGDSRHVVPAAGGVIATFAYPLAAPALPVPEARDQNGKPLDARALGDGREDTSAAVPAGSADAPAAITLAYPTPRTVRSATLYLPDAATPFGDPPYLPVLEAQHDGAWQRVATLPLSKVPTTVAFAPVTADRFRVVFAANTATSPNLAPPAPGAVMVDIIPGAGKSSTIAVATLALSAEPRVNRFEVKAGFAAVPDYYALDAGVPNGDGIDPSKVIDLTGKVRPDGTLDWTPPAGRWRIVRLGWSLLGTTNHPAAPDSTGLEVDKFDGAAVRRYMDHYLATYAGAMGPGGKGVDALTTDSIEAGDANWTPDLLAQFERLRGYDPRPWLPVLTGAVIASREKSDAFLYDYRRTLADLLASQHYGTIAEVAHAHGLKLYGEALESKRPQLGDDIAMRSHTDVPMAAMWAFGEDGGPQMTQVGDVLGAASVAHVYGQNLVAAESFTSAFAPWDYTPDNLRHIADLEFALGVNRPVIHTSVLSPPDDKLPGLSLAIFGQDFNRHECWAGVARPWVDYLARTGFLLQEGQHVADVAYFFGEEAPLTQLYADGRLSAMPTRHGFDFVDADALLDQLSVKNGVLTANSGVTYRALYLGGTSKHMTLPVLRRIATLAEAGATVIGKAPESSPSLADDKAAFAVLVGKLWAGGAVTRVGAGQVIASDDLAAALAGIGVTPDFSVAPDGDPSTLFQHRHLAEGIDIYFVDHRADRTETLQAQFRVTGRVPELWHADTGKAEPVSWRVEDGVTIVPLDMGPEDAAFVVFRRATTRQGETVSTPAYKLMATPAEPWQVSLAPAVGTPTTLTLPALKPLQTLPEARYFSGVATYVTHLKLPSADGRLLLDLGEVGNIAEVSLNGVPLGATWHAPYRIDLGKAARAGDNVLTVRVADRWVNRLIGDAQPGAAKLTYTALPTYKPDAPLRPSGLLGPVRVLEEK